MLDFFGPKKRAEKRKILVVDDELDLTQMIQDRLEMSGYQVITASNGKEGLEKAVEEKPDIMLLDVNMPVMNGFETLEALRKKPESTDCVVMMMTVRSQKEDFARAEACGIEDYVVKPFELGALIEKIDEVLERCKAAVK
jgi:two-component system alkaline phosphatase synthesis response regulator PhoP